MKATELLNYKPKNCSEVYELVNSRQILALMFHDEMADLFNFLNLPGFKCMHEYQYMAESIEHRNLKRYYTNHHNKLLPIDELEPLEVIPDDWYQHQRGDVTPNIQKQYLQKAFEWYHTWEADTKTLYSRCAAYLLTWEYAADFKILTDLVTDVDDELDRVQKLHLCLKSVDYDPVFVAELQDSYRKRYKHKMKHIGDLVK